MLLYNIFLNFTSYSYIVDKSVQYFSLKFIFPLCILSCRVDELVSLLLSAINVAQTTTVLTSLMSWLCNYSVLNFL